MIRSRCWCFTINNDTFEDLKSLIDSSFAYLIFGFEQGKKGTHHIQGYIYFTSARSQQSMKKLMPRAHLEVSRGTPDQNEDYCSKEGDYYEFGEKPSQGKATFDKIEEAMKNPRENFQLFHQYRKAYAEYKNMEKKDHDPTLLALSEKRKFEYCKSSDKSVCMYPSVYDGEDVHILPFTECELNKMMMWLNKIPIKYKVGYEVKTYNPEIIIITYDTNWDRQQIFKYYNDYLSY